MSAPAAIEAIVLRTSASETKANGLTRTVTFLVPNEGEHPFQGLVGTRLHLVCVRINDDESADAPAGGGEAEVAALTASPPQERQPGPGEYGAKRRTAWADLPPSQQCAIRCGEADFREWILKGAWDMDGSATEDQSVAERVRELCAVPSRRDLDTNHRARVIWHQLDTAYLRDTGRLAHG